MKHLASTVILCFLIIVPALPQDIDDYISRYSETNGKGYIQPVADVFGASFNSGLFHSAKLKKMGFQMYLGIVATAAFIPEKSRTFTATTEGSFEPVQTAEVPTIVGSPEPVEVTGNAGTTYAFPGGINATFLPFAVPQFSIGSVFGTDATIRYFAYPLGDDVGDLSLFSWGLRHSISQYIKVLPLELAAGFYSQKFTVGDYMDATAWIANIQASKKISLFTFYGGLGYEKSTLKLRYEEDGDEGEEGVSINYDLDGGNTIRFTAGITFNFGPVKLNVDYNLAKQSVLSAGLGIGIGEK
jgi:hypothetical protein